MMFNYLSAASRSLADCCQTTVTKNSSMSSQDHQEV